MHAKRLCKIRSESEADNPERARPGRARGVTGTGTGREDEDAIAAESSAKLLFAETRTLTVKRFADRREELVRIHQAFLGKSSLGVCLFESVIVLLWVVYIMCCRCGSV